MSRNPRVKSSNLRVTNSNLRVQENQLTDELVRVWTYLCVLSELTGRDNGKDELNLYILF